MNANENTNKDYEVRAHHSRMGGDPIFLGSVIAPPPIKYGQTLSLSVPNVEPNGGLNLEVIAELSPDNETQWTRIDPRVVLPVSGDGCYLRYRATTELGTSVTESVQIHIEKADYDMENVRWKELEDTVYDGMLKMVKLEGLPDGVEAEYTGNKAYTVGEYTASAILSYDEKNFNPPEEVPDFNWEVTKAVYDTSRIEWVYDEPYIFNEMSHTVKLTGVPAGINVKYEGNEAKDAGEYTAVAKFEYDELDYEDPCLEDMSLEWKILPAKIDMSMVHWQENMIFTYDGITKRIEVENLPENVYARYEGNEAEDAGQYTAAAYFYHEDENNYDISDALVTKWEIKRASVDTSNIRWDYQGPFVYDGGLKVVELKGVPEGIVVNYKGNAAVDAGVYNLSASFVILNENNYYPLEDTSFEWEIKKADYDMSGISWDYEQAFIYDGTIRSLELVGLPEGVTADYIDASEANAGTYEARAILHYDEKNYNEPTVPTCKWGIIPAEVDTSGVNWATHTPLVYDGTAHTIYLTGLPDFINVEYTGNVATDAGSYYATAKLTSIDSNYLAPSVDDCSWKIARARWSFDDLEWNTKEDIYYDGTVKKVYLTNVPEAFDVFYIDNENTDAGKYLATATLKSKSKNIEDPEPFTHVWEIKKADYDMSNVKWRYEDSVIYSGEELCNELIGLPESVRPVYRDNIAKDAGRYITEAYFEVRDEKNYNVPKTKICSWEIKKADVDTSKIAWVGDLDAVYDGNLKKVELVGVPQGVTVKYAFNEASAVGVYNAVAVLQHPDEKNYNEIETRSLEWEIKKGKYDFSNVRWTYDGPFVYDGTPKSITLTGIPEGVTPVYDCIENTNAGKYIAVAGFLINDDCFEKPWVEPLEWEIKKADIDMSGAKWVELADMVYDGEKKGVWLVGCPDGIEPMYSGHIAVDAGEYTAVAAFRYDEINYNKPVVENYNWSIKPAPVDPGTVSWDKPDAPFVYDGQEHSVHLVEGENVTKTKKGLFSKTEVTVEKYIMGLPEGMSVETEGDRATEVGTYIARAYVCPPAEDTNHTKSAPIECRWEIGEKSEGEN